MSALAIYIILGDLLVCAAVVGLAIWLMALSGERKEELDKAAKLPLEEPAAEK